VHGYSVAFWVSAVLFGVGALVAVLLVPSRGRLEELRNQVLEIGAEPATVLADSTAPAAGPVLTDSLSADDGVPTTR
jgi:hypothetical protein